eukprot:GGOE01047770.1.p1 GENE.GGOE01047770.1~~GGOE01047770.1.p1  ORF type:complete len:199 (+),score=17.78 GGOE01047770.1:34-597(+)
MSKSSSGASPPKGSKGPVANIPPPPGGPLKLLIPPDPVITDAQQDAIREPHVQKVRQILHHLRLEQYFEPLVENGYDDVRSLYCLTEDDLVQMSFEVRHAQRFLKWVKANAAAISPKPGNADMPPPSPQVESKEWVYTRPLGNPISQTPVSPTSNTFVHSPYTFFPYAAVSPSSVSATPTAALMASP